MKNQATKLHIVRDPSGRAPAHDLDAERAVLAAAILEPSVQTKVADHLSAGDFYGDGHTRIWAALEYLRGRGEAIDVVTVAAHLRQREELTGIGGAAYLAELLDGTPSIANVEEHARIIALRARRRRIVGLSQIIAAEGYGDVGDEDEWADGCATRMSEIAREARPTKGQWVSEAMAAAIDVRRRELSGSLRASAVPTGFLDLDDATVGGLHRKEITILSGMSGRGKSAFAACVAMNVAAAGHGVAYFMLEDTKERLCLRMACGQGRIDAKRCIEAKLTHDEETELLHAADYVRKLPLVIDDTKDLTPPQIESRCARYAEMLEKRGFPLSLVVIDHMQIVANAVVRERENRPRELSEIVKAFYRLTERSDVATVVLSQVNDDGQIYDSRAALTHAQNWWELEREPNRAKDGSAEVARVHVKKQRHGPMPVTSALWFHPRFVLFSDEERPS